MKYYKRSTTGLKKCSKCGEILTTEEYEKGYDYHLKCYLEIKNKKRY
jgi:ribosomal protein L37AE/L43A